MRRETKHGAKVFYIDMARRTICVFSGKRGGFGAFVPLMQLISQDPDLELQILLGDMHASKAFGETVAEAKKFFPLSRIELIEMGTGRGDTPLIRAENLGTLHVKATHVLSRLNPDIVLVHGDRGDHLMIASVALNLGKVVAHTQGGEVSGNIDDMYRHAITKLAHIHFPETIAAEKRIRALGEERWRIHVAGSLYIDRIRRKMYTPTSETRKRYHIPPRAPYGILIFHPNTFLSLEENVKAAKEVFKATDNSTLHWVVTYPCSDPGYDAIVSEIEKRIENPRYIIRKNIDNLDFLGLMAGAKVILGNSSCALTEAPYFQLAAVNVGNREFSRDHEENVVDSGVKAEEIRKSIKYALENKPFRKKLARCGTRLGDGTASEKVLAVIKHIPINEKLLRKKLVV